MSLTPLVLISDDDAVLANSMVRAARHAGLRAFSDTTSQAPNLAVRYQPDVVVLDLKQNIDGRQLLADMKRDPRTRDIPVVMLSGWADESTRSDCLALGAADWVTKPFPPRFFEHLASEVREHPRAEVVADLAPAPDTRKTQVVIVGDAIDRRLVSGHAVERVATAEAALALCRRTHVHVLVARQPGGVELIGRAREIFPSTRGVVIADASQYYRASQLDTGGVCHILLEPAAPAQVADAVNRAARVALARLQSSSP